ncbi:hypothetical protein KA005_76500 [bacterium]|nr:hypothetical protein [bacterium]
MTRKTGLYLDSSEFDKKFYDLVEKAIPEDARDGSFKAMNKVLRDSIELPPQAPKLIGDLWGSTAGTVKVETKRKKISVSGGFNIKYAHRHHEVPPGTYDYTLTKGAIQPGPKFMQSKMARYAKKYMQIVADAIRRRGG